MILEEFDESKTAVFDPTTVRKPNSDMPKIAVSCFSIDLLNRLVELFKGEKIDKTHNSNGDFPIYKINYNGVDIALFTSCVTAPAVVAEYEEIYALGVEKIIVFGTCGVLDKNIEDMAIIIPTSAIRDEGTSYHYCPSSEEINTNPKYINEFKKLLEEHNYSYTLGKTWTIDAIYRETRKKVERRKKQGCVCVEMESSAIFALAKFRGKEVFQFFYAADNLDGDEWNSRSLLKSNLSETEKIGLLAINFAEKISKL